MFNELLCESNDPALAQGVTWRRVKAARLAVCYRFLFETEIRREAEGFGKTRFQDGGELLEDKCTSRGVGDG
jgi:hypothetical protein